MRELIAELPEPTKMPPSGVDEPVPPFATFRVPARVIVPALVIGPPDVLRPVDPPEKSTEVTLPLPELVVTVVPPPLLESL